MNRSARLPFDPALPRPRWIAVLLLLLLGSPVSANPAGKDLYQKQCAECHGVSGEGVDEAYDEPLHGGRTLDALTEIINDTMPEEDPDLCTGDDARRVAEFIYQTFYTEEARARNKPARIELSRMTARQYLNSTADLIAAFVGQARPDAKRGLTAKYHNSKNFNKLVIDRVDAQVDFDFGNESPQPGKIGKDEFSIQWQGMLLAEETGLYEIVVTTDNGIRLWLNDAETPLIDGWVQSGSQTEHRATIRLLGGRAYPIRLDFFKFKQDSAAVKLQWQPPHRVQELIPERNLAPGWCPPTIVITTEFPADDSSIGYERGTSVSKSWDEATTYAAIEIANRAADHLNTLAKTKDDDPKRAERVQDFCAKFAERAFRRPLSDEQKRFFVTSHFENAPDLQEAAKRSILLVLKSPRFLYTERGAKEVDDYDVASRISFALWDSLPDDALLQAATQGQLRSPQQVAAQAKRMLTDPRTKSKVRYFLHQWLHVERGFDISKDKDEYPDFDQQIMSDALTSLDLMLDEVIWNSSSDFRELLLADYLFANPKLCEFYGLEQSADDFAKVACDPQQRSGVLTHPYLMLSFAYLKHSSPIHRGVFLTRGVLGRALKPPPIAVAPADEGLDPNMTTRERVAFQTKPDACNTCHSMINPLGFALENYDAVGRYRSEENGRAVDASGFYKPTEGESVEFTGARELAEFLADSQEVHRSFVEQLFHQLVKQPIAAYDGNVLKNFETSFADSDCSVQNLLVEIVKATALQTN